jgi:acetyl-CoA carboxylase biotin carboxylase subunit
LQLQIAAGGKLPFRQSDVQLRGHAIECRIYAEDPENNFFPSPGKIGRLMRPSGPGIREDSGVYEGWTVPLDYDPMLSKLIAFAPDRRTAIARMRRALSEYFIGGIKSNLGLFRRILDQPDFQEGRIDTGFLDRLLSSPACDLRLEDSLEKLAALSAALFVATAPPKSNGQNGASTSSAAGSSAWKRAARFEGVGNE